MGWAAGARAWHAHARVAGCPKHSSKPCWLTPAPHLLPTALLAPPLAAPFGRMQAAEEDGLTGQAFSATRHGHSGRVVVVGGGGAGIIGDESLLTDVCGIWHRSLSTGPSMTLQSTHWLYF